MNTILLFLTFSTLAIITILVEDRRLAASSRTNGEWTADIAGLAIQGVLIPLFPFLFVPFLIKLFPEYHATVEIHPAVQFLISFVMIDYFYYWNHRYFHKRTFWPVHRLHHSCRHLDIFATSRNSLITSFLFVYVWSQILGMYILKDSTAFMLGLGLTFALDLWRHSGLKQPVIIHKLLGWVLILPEQHVLHHSLNGRTKNYGANLCWWDKLHGTYSGNLVANKELEKLQDRDVWSELLTPWRTK